VPELSSAFEREESRAQSEASSGLASVASRQIHRIQAERVIPWRLAASSSVSRSASVTRNWIGVLRRSFGSSFGRPRGMGKM